jgi:hypothetical protein
VEASKTTDSRKKQVTVGQLLLMHAKYPTPGCEIPGKGLVAGFYCVSILVNHQRLKFDIGD